MLYLHKNPKDTLGTEIKDYLLNISAAHKVIDIAERSSFLAENEQEFHGREAIMQFLASYNKQMVLNRMASADACFMDPETGMTC